MVDVLNGKTTKRHFFNDEQEVRAVVCAITADEFKLEHMMPDGCGYMSPVNVTELTEAVLLHPEATPEFAEKVAPICAAHGL